MPVAAPLAIAGATLGSAALGASAASKAAKAQTNAANQANQTQRDIFDKQTALQEPFRQGGMAAESRLLELLGLAPPGGNTAGGLNVNPATADFGKYAKDFSMNDFTADPGYGFRLSEGTKALNNSMAASGLRGSGAALKAGERFGQDLASQEYQNAFNRYQVNRSNQLNPLQSLMGGAQSSANTLTGAAGQMGQTIGENQLQAGNARASGYVGGANALTGALSSGFQAYTGLQSANSLNSFLNNSGGGASWGLPSGFGGGQPISVYNNPDYSAG